MEDILNLDLEKEMLELDLADWYEQAGDFITANQILCHKFDKNKLRQMKDEIDRHNWEEAEYRYYHEQQYQKEMENEK